MSGASVRIITLNLWGDNGDAARRMQVLVQHLVALEPAVVTLQEVLEAPGRIEQAKEIARALGADYRFFPTDPDVHGGAFGNAIVSRLPIRASSHVALPTAWGERRAAGRCELETSHGVLSVTTAHLSFELDAAPVREAQAVALDEFARAGPGPLPPVLTGDFNCTPDSDVMRFFRGRRSIDGRGTYWRDAFQRRHPRSNGFTWSSRNGFAKRSVERDRRIDYILLGPTKDRGPGSVMHARVVLDLPGADGIYPSDHFGVFAEMALVPPDGEGL